MRVEDFVENSHLFKETPSVIHVPTRQFPVQMHFSKFTPSNYLAAALKKTAQIHRKLPPGGILVFVTGQQEVKTLVKQLKLLFPSKSSSTNKKIVESSVSEETKPAVEKKRTKKFKGKEIAPLKTFDLDEMRTIPLNTMEEDEDDDNSEEELEEGFHLAGVLDENDDTRNPLHVLPLYSMLPSAEQQKVGFIFTLVISQIKLI